MIKILYKISHLKKLQFSVKEIPAITVLVLGTSCYWVTTVSKLSPCEMQPWLKTTSLALAWSIFVTIMKIVQSNDVGHWRQEVILNGVDKSYSPKLFFHLFTLVLPPKTNPTPNPQNILLIIDWATGTA